MSFLMDCYHDRLRTLVYHHFLFTTGINELTRFHRRPINRPKIHYQFSLLIHTFSRVFSLAMQYGEGYSDLVAADDTPLPSPTPLWLPRIMTVASPTSPSPAALACCVIVAHRLPLRVAQDPIVLFGFTFTYQLRSGLPAGAPVLHIGTLPMVRATSVVSDAETTDLNWPMSIPTGSILTVIVRP
jgi:hypothetical protein